MNDILTKTILITGGTGFAGSHLVEALLERGYQNIHVTTFDLRETYVGQLLPPNHIHTLDLTDKDSTHALLQQLQPEHIYHLAAAAAVGKSFDVTKKTLDNNLHLQLNLFDAIKKQSSQARILAVGSALEYDTLSSEKNEKFSELSPLGPSSPYALSKILQDMLAFLYFQSHKLNIVRVRPFNHIGERQALGFVVSDFAKQIIAIENGTQSEIRVGNLDAVRDFTDVKDISQGYILLMEKGTVGEVYNLGSARGYSIQEILDTLIKFSSKTIEVVVDQEKFRPLDVASVIADNEKIKKLGWEPVIPITDTLKRVLEWHRNVNY